MEKDIPKTDVDVQHSDGTVVSPPECADFGSQATGVPPPASPEVAIAPPLAGADTKKIIGIDLGTTNSLVAIIENGRPRIIPNERGSRTTPSVVSIKPGGKPIIGEMARNQAVLNAAHTVANVKLEMGGSCTYHLNGRDYKPEEISGLVLSKLKSDAETYLGEKVDEAVITVPVYFDDNQRRATMDAAACAGLRVRKLLNEPTAAALAYSSEGDRPDSNILVVDMGGGTLDITLVEYANKVFRVRATGGSTKIGGVDFDKQIINHILADFKDTSSCDLSGDQVALQQLVIQTEKTKVDLSSSMETSIMIPYITIAENGPLHLNKTLTRSLFESLIAPILSEIKKIILATFEKGNLATDWVDSVILVGGSTRVPAIEEMILAILDPDGQDDKKQDIIKKSINQDEAVAAGAAIMVGIFSGELADIEFQDITPHDLGLLNHEGEFEVLVPAGTVFPMEITRLFSTVHDHQKEVTIEVMQEKGRVENRELVTLGSFNLQVNPEKMKGEPNIDVTFTIDLNEILTVSAVNLDTHEKETIRIDYEV